MNKNKIIMSAIGGVAGVIILVLGYLAFSTYSEQTEMEESLEASKQNVRRMNAAKIPPVEASVKAIDENRDKLTTWFNEALALASRGDAETKSGVTVAAFKQEMVDDARELAKLPGTANGGVLVAEGFGFGFKDIITGGRMPEADKLARLQRQWAEIKLFVETLAACGVSQLTDIAVGDKPAVQPKPAARPSRGNRRTKNVKKEATTHTPDGQCYELHFLAKPAAFVRVLNALGSASRFVAVDDFAFLRADDSLATVLGGGKEKAAAGAQKGGRRRRASARETAETNQPEEIAKKGLVTDPATAAPLTVTLKLTTFDFGSQASASGQTEDKEDEE